METKSLTAILSAKDSGFTSTFSKANTLLGEFSNVQTKAAAAGSKFSASLKEIASGMDSVSVAASNAVSATGSLTATMTTESLTIYTDSLRQLSGAFNDVSVTIQNTVPALQNAGIQTASSMTASAASIAAAFLAMQNQSVQAIQTVLSSLDNFKANADISGPMVSSTSTTSGAFSLMKDAIVQAIQTVVTAIQGLKTETSTPTPPTLFETLMNGFKQVKDVWANIEFAASFKEKWDKVSQTAREGLASMKEIMGIFKLEFHESFRSILDSGETSQFQAKFKAMKDAVEYVFPSTSKFKTKMTELGNSTTRPGSSLKQLGSTMKGSASTIEGAGKGIQNSATAVGTGFEVMSQTAATAIKSADKALISSGIGGILVAIGLAVSGFALAWKNNFMNIQGVMKTFGGVIAKSFDSLKGVFSSLKPVLQPIIAIFKGAFVGAISGVVIVVALLVDAFRSVVIGGMNIVETVKGIYNGFVGLKRLFSGDFAGAGEAFSSVGDNINNIKNNMNSFYKDSSLRKIPEVLGKFRDGSETAAEAQQRLAATMDATKASASELTGEFSKLSQEIQENSQRINEAFEDNEVMTKFNDSTLKLVEDGGKSRQEAVEKYNQAITKADGKSVEERKEIFKAAGDAFITELQRNRGDLVTTYDQYNDMILSNTDKSGNQLNDSQRIALMRQRNTAFEELDKTNQTIFDQMTKRVEMGGQIDKDEYNQTMANLKEMSKKRADTIKTNTEEIKRLRDKALTMAEGNDKQRIIRAYQNLEDENKGLLERQKSFGKTYLDLLASQNTTKIGDITKVLAKEKDLTDDNIVSIMESYREQNKNVDDQMSLLAGILQSRGVEGAENLDKALKSGKPKKIMEAIKGDVESGLAGLPDNMFINGAEGKKQFIEALKKTGNIEEAAKFLTVPVSDALEKLPKQGEKTGKELPKSAGKGVEASKDEVKGPTKNAADGAVNSFKEKEPEFKDAGNTAGFRYAEGLDTRKNTVKNSAKTLVSYAKEGFSSNNYADIEDIGNTTGYHYAVGLDTRQDTVRNSTEALVNVAREVFLSKNTDIQDVGNTTGYRYAVGLDERQDTVRNSAKALVNAAGEGFFSQNADVQDIGNTAGYRYAVGLDTRQGTVENSARNLGDAVKASLSSRQADIQAIGNTAGAGYAAGLDSRQGSVRSSAQALADVAKEGLSSRKASIRDEGNTAGYHYAEGIKSRDTYVEDKARSLGTTAKDALASRKNSIHDEGDTAGYHYAEGIKDRDGYVEDAGRYLANRAKDGMSSVDFFSVGGNMAEGVAAGIRERAYVATNAMSGLVSQINNEANKVAKVNSPSKLMRDGVGNALAEGLAVGIEQRTGNAVEATSAVTNLVRGVNDEARNIKGIRTLSWIAQKRLGHYLAMGIAVGIQQKQRLAAIAMIALIKLVNFEARKIAKINSPSKLMRDGVGKGLAEGVAVGIKKNTKLAVEEAGNLVDGVYQAMSSVTNPRSNQLNLALEGQVEYGNDQMIGRLDQMIQLLEQKNQIVLDTGELVGATVTAYDERLGQNAGDNRRWH